MLSTIKDAIRFVLREQGEPQSPYWLASQMEEMRLWQASEHDARAALEQDIAELGQQSVLVAEAEGEYS